MNIIGISLGKLFIGISKDTELDKLKNNISKVVEDSFQAGITANITKMEAYILQSVFVGGIHALLVNKGYQVPYSEINELYDTLKSNNEVLFEMCKKYVK